MPTKGFDGYYVNLNAGPVLFNPSRVATGGGDGGLRENVKLSFIAFGGQVEDPDSSGTVDNYLSYNLFHSLDDGVDTGGGAS